ncbi:MAG: putative glycosyltransferase [Rhizobium sp.]|nr:putative glycosyltransferase [Rhizobium sp.]
MDRAVKLSGAETGGSIARLVIVLPGLGAGGSEHVVSIIANHWAHLGHDVTILTLEPPGSYAYYALSPSIRVIRLGVPPQRASGWKAAWLALQRVRRMRREIRSIRPDFVLSFLTRTNVLSLIATFGTGIATIVSERNNPGVQPFGALWKWLQKWLYPRAFGLITMTRGALEFFPPRMRKRSWVIPNAVDLPSTWVNRRGGNVLTAVGRLTHQKGFDLLLDAFAKIAASFPDWTLVIWGEGEDRRQLEDRRKTLGLEGRVDLPGITAKPGQWVETANVFVLSSRYEGWGIVLLEAMAAGLPVVSFNCDFGPSEMVEHGQDGLLVAPENVDALAEAMAQLLRDKQLRERLSANAVRTALRYTPECVLAEWDGVLRDVLADRIQKVTA